MQNIYLEFVSTDLSVNMHIGTSVTAIEINELLEDCMMDLSLQDGRMLEQWYPWLKLCKTGLLCCTEPGMAVSDQEKCILYGS